MVTTLGIAFGVIFLIVVLFRRDLFPLFVAVTVPFQSAAMFSVGGFFLSPFHFAAIVACGILLLHAITRVRLGAPRLASFPARSLLVLYAIGALLVTALSPTLFNGLRVFSPTRSLDSQLGNTTALAFTSSNVAQLIYLFLGLGVALYLARSVRNAELLALAFWVGIAFGYLRMGLREIGLESSLDLLLDNRTDRNYSVFESRARGSFSEPSDFGTFMLVAAVYFTIRALHGTSARVRISSFLGAILASVCVVLSGSGTTLIATPIVVVLILAWGAFSAIRMRTFRLAPSYFFVGLFLVAALGVNLGTIVSNLTSGLASKVDSNSFLVRSAADVNAVETFFDTLGLGAGLGSIRASGFAATQLGSVGVVGFLLLLIAFVVLTLSALKQPGFVAAGGALVAIVVAKSIAGPDLSTPLLWMLIGVTMAANLAVHAKPIAATNSDIDRDLVGPDDFGPTTPAGLRGEPRS